MKRFVVALLLACVVLAGAAAQDVTANWDSYFKTGNTALSVGVGFGYWALVSVAVYPGIEVTVADFKIGDVVPLSISVAARGLVNPYFGAGYSGIEVGGGLFVPFHLSLKGLDIAPLDRVDIYTAPGIALNFDLGTYWGAPMRFGFASYGGFNYFVNDSFAVFAEGTYWTYYGGGAVGILLKL